MKVNLVKNAGGIFSPADEESEDQLRKLKNCDYYSCDIKLNHNYKLLQKIHVFFKFCAQHYYGDINVTADQIDLTREKITMSAGHVKQIFLPAGYDENGTWCAAGVRFELRPKSISYANMLPEARAEIYTKIVNSAMKNVFHSADENTFNQLMSYF